MLNYFVFGEGGIKMVRVLEKRAFNGKTYLAQYYTRRESNAVAYAKKLREEGNFARVVKKKSRFVVFYRSKRWK